VNRLCTKHVNSLLQGRGEAKTLGLPILHSLPQIFTGIKWESNWR